ncbi:catalase family peroxidase [Coralliovum pocilloporae]|uniref:catalase family peroxidase n=1 Tax=Coralliovum pocilloporae TaxID=3066369 RepID=UPI003307C05A
MSKTFLLWSSLALAATGVTAQAEETNPVDGEVLVNKLNGVFGRHAAKRASGAKGFCAAGYLEPTAEAGQRFTSPLFQPGQHQASIRFSNGGGNPASDDRARSTRGIGVKMELPDDDTMDWAGSNVPMFVASTPEEFVEYLTVRAKDPVTGKKDKAAIDAYSKANPHTLKTGKYIKARPAPASVASTPYFMIHTFYLEGQDGKSHPVRWVFQPEGGYVGLTAEQEKTMPKDFLEAEFKGRVTSAPARWSIMVQFPKEGDPLNNANIAWPDDRETMKVGTLVANSYVTKGSANDCTGQVYDPLALPDGIEPSDDPMLEARSSSYAVSLTRRSE